MFKRFAIALIFLFSGVSANAQIQLEVTIMEDSTRNPVVGIEVSLENKAIGARALKTTDDQGKARFPGLPTSGAYTVSVAATDDYLEASASNIVLRSNFDASVNLTLLRRKLYRLQGVTVYAPTATKLNTINAEVSSELRTAEIETLPIEGRDITRALYRLPNVVQATGFFPEAPNVSVNGANSLYANYLIDGLDNNENFLGGQKFAIPVGFTQNVTVLTNNYSTEFGLTGNGVFNITSRSGSNEFSGEAFYITRPGPSIDGESPFAQRDLSGNQVKDGFQRHQGGFAFGGALDHDRTFYYVNAEQTLDLKDNLLNSPQLGVNETVQGNNRFSYLSGKIDHLWGGGFKSSLRANLGLVNIERQGGGLDGGLNFPSAGNSQDRNSLIITSKNYYLAKNFSSETNLQYSRFRWNYGKADNPSSPSVSVLDPSEQLIAYLGHPGYIFDQTENTVQAEEKLNFYLKNHTLKFGVGVISSDHALLGGGNENGNYTVKLSQAQLSALQASNLGSDLEVNDIPGNVQVLGYNVELRPSAFGKRQNIFSAYIEDQFSASSKLNLTLGVRYDYDNLSVGGSDTGDKNNIAPRFSFNYKLSETGSFRGGYGLFFEKILYAIYSDALQFNTTSADYKKQIAALVSKGILPVDTNIDRVTREGNLSASLSNVAYLRAPGGERLQSFRDQAFSNELRILNPNGYQNPYTHQFSLGYQHQIDNEKLFYIDLIHTRSYNLFRLRDLNAPSAYPLNDPNNVVVRSQAAADATRPVPIFTDSRGGYAIVDGDTLRGIARNVVVTETAGESRYYAASVNLQKDKGDDNFSYRLIYTLSYLKNNTEDINFRAQDANNFEAEWGPSINDRRHVMNAIFSYYPAERLAFTLAALLQSGQPINRVPDARVYGTSDLNGDGRSFGNAYVGNSDRQPGESRNNDRLPWSSNFDLGVQYDFALAGNSAIQLRADVFNLFDAENLSGYSNNATQSNQIQVGSKSSGVLARKNAGAPRQFQFSLRYAF